MGERELETDWNARIQALNALALPRFAGEVAALTEELGAASLCGALPEAARKAFVSRLVELVESDEGQVRARLACGELLGMLGDVRLHVPSEDAYWARLELQSGDAISFGRFPVTNQEYRAWVASGGYDDKAAWSADGLAWLSSVDDAWPTLDERGDAGQMLVANQPVVGVSWFEADAYARAMNARLPRWYERVWAVRGSENRPYPWGDPFGVGNSNTKEEVLGRPCAVGLYGADQTPEGVRDLAGNVGEWTADSDGNEYLLHPGSWDQPSLAAWAKALTTEPPTSRWAALGFRLVSDR